MPGSRSGGTEIIAIRAGTLQPGDAIANGTHNVVKLPYSRGVGEPDEDANVKRCRKAIYLTGRVAALIPAVRRTQRTHAAHNRKMRFALDGKDSLGCSRERQRVDLGSAVHSLALATTKQALFPRAGCRAHGNETVAKVVRLWARRSDLRPNSHKSVYDSTSGYLISASIKIGGAAGRAPILKAAWVNFSAAARSCPSFT